ncbi:MAG TPA: ferric reductase-like transmembrane domain-containing protein [Candidatus Thermoplasmatota archaeon]|nr:ferric reductase-like transmembrane domain-containing protein [Candidatus Thermoplasmatota archaeon]
MRSVRPLLVVAILVAVAALAVAQRGGESGFVPEKATTCWPCHESWNPPLRSMYDIIPPPSAGASSGAGFDYTVRIRNPWLADLTYLEPTLDLSEAPSLAFAGGREPTDASVDGTLTVNPSTPTEPQRGFVVVEVPEGASSLRLTLTPGSSDAALGPDLRMRIFPGATAPTGSPDTVVNEAGRGAAEVFEVPGPAGFRSRGYGNWTVEAEYLAVDPATGTAQPTPGSSIPFTVRAEARFDVSGESAQVLARRTQVAPDGSSLFSWHLLAVGEPEFGEYARLRVNTTSYFKHLPSSDADDYGNFTKSLDVAVLGRDGGVFLEPQGLVIAAPQTVVGVSMARISEAVGYVSAFLLIASVWTGGMFGKASRRQLNRMYGSAKRRVAFHNVLSYGLTVAALAHTVLFVVETDYHWTVGLLLGGIGILAMLFLGVTGALQVPMIRRWNYATWRWSHYGLAVAAILFSALHMALDGQNLANWFQWVGWEDPLVPKNLG